MVQLIVTAVVVMLVAVTAVMVGGKAAPAVVKVKLAEVASRDDELAD